MEQFLLKLNTFKFRLDNFWSDQDVLYDYNADLYGIGNRIFISVMLFNASNACNARNTRKLHQRNRH